MVSDSWDSFRYFSRSVSMEGGAAPPPLLLIIRALVHRARKGVGKGGGACCSDAWARGASSSGGRSPGSSVGASAGAGAGAGPSAMTGAKVRADHLSMNVAMRDENAVGPDLVRDRCPHEVIVLEARVEQRTYMASFSFRAEGRLPWSRGAAPGRLSCRERSPWALGTFRNWWQLPPIA